MKKKNLAILLSLIMVVTSFSAPAMALATEDTGAEDEAYLADDDADGESDGADAASGTSDMTEQGAEGDGSSQEFEAGGASADSQMVWGGSEEDVEELPTGEEEEQSDGARDDEMLTGVVPTHSGDDDMILGLFPTNAPGDDDRVVTEEAEEIAVGESSMPDPDEISARPDDVVAMVMPVMTGEMYDYTIDPFNILGRYSEKSSEYEFSSLYFKNSGEEIRYSGMSDPAVATNRSSVPVLMYVSLSMNNVNGWPVDFTGMDEVNKDEKANISFAIVPVGEKDGKAVYYREKQIETDSEGRAQAVFCIDGSPDNFVEYEGQMYPRDDADWKSLGFAIAGATNKDGDWSEILTRSKDGEKMNIVISCRMKPLSESEKEAFEAGEFNFDEETGLVDSGSDGV